MDEPPIATLWPMDLLATGLRVLFIGFNPSPASFERGLNYAGRNNRFYAILFHSGLTPVLHSPAESRQFLERYGFGFTNLADRPTQRADELTREEYKTGATRLRSTLRQLRPRVACYVGKGVYEAFSGRHQQVAWGFQPTVQVDGTRDFVAPSSSGLVRMTLQGQVDIYAELATFLVSTHL